MRNADAHCFGIVPPIKKYKKRIRIVLMAGSTIPVRSYFFIFFFLFNGTVCSQEILAGIAATTQVSLWFRITSGDCEKLTILIIIISSIMKCFIRYIVALRERRAWKEKRMRSPRRIRVNQFQWVRPNPPSSSVTDTQRAKSSKVKLKKKTVKGILHGSPGGPSFKISFNACSIIRDESERDGKREAYWRSTRGISQRRSNPPSVAFPSPVKK